MAEMQARVRLSQFGETYESDEGVAILDEGTVILEMSVGEDVDSIITLTPEAAITAGRSLAVAGRIAARARARALKERRHG